MATVSIAESHVAEQAVAGAGAVPAHFTDFRAHFETMLPAKVTDLVLELPDLVEEAGSSPVDLRESRQADSCEVHAEYSPDVRQVRREPLDAQVPDHFRPVQRSFERIVVIGVTKANLVDQPGAECVPVRDRECLVAAELPPRPE